MNNFSFPFHLAFYSFAIVLIFFMSLIYTEDILLFQKLEVETGWQPNPEVYLGRVLIAISFSVGVGIFSYIFAVKFTLKLREFSQLILDWARRYLPEYDLSLDSGYKEINELKETFRYAVYSNKSKETANISNIIDENNKLFIEQILPFLQNFEKPNLPNLDIALFPNKSFLLANDYLDCILTRKGIIFILAGFSQNDPLTASYKARLQSIISFAKEVYYLEEEELLSAIQTTIRTYKVPKLNLTLFFVNSETFVIKFLHFQRTPILIWNETQLEEIPVMGETEYPFIEYNSDLRSQVLNINNYFIVISDRILDKKFFESEKYLIDWKKNIEANKIYFTSAKQILEHLRLYLDSILKEKGSTEKVDDFYSCIVVGRKGEKFVKT
jgi:Arg-Lys translocation region protein phosphatase